MNSFTSISFAILFLLKGTAPGIDLGCELQKLPNLLDHYQEHKTCNDGSFWQFFVNDYLNIDGESEAHHDDSNHDELPFHGSHQCCNPSVFYATAGQLPSIAVAFAVQTKFGFYQSFLSAEFSNSFFQPPKSLV